MRRLSAVLFAVCMVSASATLGCGGTSSGNLPVDSPLIEFQAPDSEDLVPAAESAPDEEEDDWDLGGDEETTDESKAGAAPAAASPQ